jgi:hypothetical protein
MNENKATLLLTNPTKKITVQHMLHSTVITDTVPVGGGFAISNSTVPLSKSRILKRVKSISYTLASGEQR